MKFLLGFSLVFLLITFGKEIDAIRRGQEEYWKAVMGGEEMPEAINGLLFDQQEGNPSGGERMSRSSHFNRDFDVSAVDAIIYHPYHHHHPHPEDPKTTSNAN